MKKALTMLGVVLGVLCFYVTLGQAEKKNANSIIVESTIKNIRQKDIDRVRNEGEKGLTSICSLLGIENTPQITIKIVEGGICYADGVIISLPIRRVRQKKAAIVHEVTHVITRHSYNRFFSEGLAVYFQERFGEDHGFPNFSGKPLHKLAVTCKDRFTSLVNLSLERNNAIFNKVGSEERTIAYIQAGSFICFLTEQYGEEKLRALHNSARLDYEKIYGKNISVLEQEWRKFLLTI